MHNKRNEKYIKHNYTDLTGKVYNGVTFIEYLYSRKHQNYWKCRCHCGELFTARETDIKSGHTKSCGCLRCETTRKTGISNRTHNIMQPSQLFNYARVFYNGKRKYFIIEKDADSISKISPWCYSRQKRSNGNHADPIRIFNRKLIKASRELANTPDNLECDHINHQPEDCRKSNLRNGTQLQNKANTPNGVGRVVRLKKGKFGIKFPDELGIDTSTFEFSMKEQAEEIRRKIEAEIFGLWTYEASQKIAKENETFEFVLDPNVDNWANTGTLGEIIQLSPDNILNARLHDLKVLIKGGYVTPDEEWWMQHNLIYDYHNMQ